MAFQKISLILSDSYKIIASKQDNNYEISLYHESKEVGRAHFVTDGVDVSCITDLSIDPNHAQEKIHKDFTLAHALIKFTLKFPTLIRKPEFRFVLSYPQHVADILTSFNFDQGRDTSIEKEIMVRSQKTLPSVVKKPDGISFIRTVSDNHFRQALSLLKSEAYWQEHLTPERLRLLVNNSNCYLAIDHEKVVGFARMLTDTQSFASLWDVVVAKPYRNRGVGSQLMLKIFEDPTLSSIDHWVLFTDTAKPFYQKFGFTEEKNIPERKFLHKLRLQESVPSYMSDLSKAIEAGLPEQLTESQSLEYLFGEKGKRSNLAFFWESHRKLSTETPISDQATSSLGISDTLGILLKND